MRSRLRRCLAAAAAALVLAVAASAAQPDDELPVVVVLATSGDIHGLAQLFVAVPQATRLATLRGEQVAAGASPAGSDDPRLKLVRRIEEAASLPEVAGIAVTHDASTIDDTAAYLRRALKTAKPIVLTVAAAGEGKQNFHDAVAMAAHKGAGRGVIIVR